MEIKRFVTPYMRSCCYVVLEDMSGIIIDPCEQEEVKYLVQKSIHNISCCILTHEHYDHISGLEWMHSLKVPVIVSEACNKGLANAKINQSRYYDLFCMVQRRLEGDTIPDVKEYEGYADKIFSDEVSFEWKGHYIFLKETPGHSKGSICILIDNKYLFSGDTLFSDRDTNCGILGGDKEQLWRISMPWIDSLDKNITVYPGHYESFKLGERMKGKSK